MLCLFTVVTDYNFVNLWVLLRTDWTRTSQDTHSKENLHLHHKTLIMRREYHAEHLQNTLQEITQWSYIVEYSVYEPQDLCCTTTQLLTLWEYDELACSNSPQIYNHMAHYSSGCETVHQVFLEITCHTSEQATGHF